MKVTGTIINYYFHCKRQCYLFANKINLEDNSEDVRIGRVMHELRAEEQNNSEVKFDGIVVDKITGKYVEEFKKSDSDLLAAKMQVLFYLKKLDEKGIKREGKLVCKEKNKNERIEKIVLDDLNNKILDECVGNIEKLINSDIMPSVEKDNKCKKCAYYEYCYI